MLTGPMHSRSDTRRREYDGCARQHVSATSSIAATILQCSGLPCSMGGLAMVEMFKVRHIIIFPLSLSFFFLDSAKAFAYFKF